MRQVRAKEQIKRGREGCVIWRQSEVADSSAERPWTRSERIEVDAVVLTTSHSLSQKLLVRRGERKRKHLVEKKRIRTQQQRIGQARMQMTPTSDAVADALALVVELLGTAVGSAAGNTRAETATAPSRCHLHPHSQCEYSHTSCRASSLQTACWCLKVKKASRETLVS